MEWFERVNRDVDDLGVLFEYYQAGDVTMDEVDKQYKKSLDELEHLEFQATFTSPEDEMSCIMEINSGAGGTESQDWVQMLMRMYMMYAQKNGFKVSELDMVYGEVAGIKSCSLEIKLLSLVALDNESFHTYFYIISMFHFYRWNFLCQASSYCVGIKTITG